MADANLQYLRKCVLIVSGRNVGGLDLSELRIKFSIKRSDSATPNTADIRVYNLSEQTAIRIRKEFTQVVLEAGYEGNSGVIFQGNIKQVILGRESATDTFIDIIAGDGDQAYNFSIVRASIAKGSSLQDQVQAAVDSMGPKGVTSGYIGPLPENKLPRGKVMYGNARNYLRTAAKTADSTWSIQNEKVTFVPKTSYAPGIRIVISATTGMIGTPQQTNEGVNVKTLLNPNIQVSGRIYLDSSSILQQKLNLDQIAAAKGDVHKINSQLPPALNSDGSYYVLVLQHSGDTRGTDWYTSMVCLNQDVSANPNNSVQVNGG